MDVPPLHVQPLLTILTRLPAIPTGVATARKLTRGSNAADMNDVAVFEAASAAARKAAVEGLLIVYETLGEVRSQSNLILLECF